MQQGLRYRILHGDAFALLRGMRASSVDAVISDPPYSLRVHAGHRGGLRSREKDRSDLGFDGLTPGQGAELAEESARVAKGWVVLMCDHELARVYLETLEAMPDRVTFAPVALMTLGGRVRMRGDGPASWLDYIIVSRPRGGVWGTWGALPGGYVAHGRDHGQLVGGKPRGFARRLIRDYTRPGDVVLDPFCAEGNFGMATMDLGHRRYLGIESDLERATVARRNLSKHRIFTGQRVMEGKQVDVF